jgi:hypothetical protein
MRDYLAPRTVGILHKGRFSREDLIGSIRRSISTAALTPS